MNEQNNVLVIAHNSFSDVLNNGKTLESLFKNFKKNELAQLFFSENEIPDFNFCENYFKISDVDVLKSTVKLRKTCGKQIVKIEENTILSQDSKNILSTSFYYAKKHASKITVFRDFFWSFNFWKSENLFSWVDDFNPKVIFYVGGDSGFSHEIAVFLSKKYNIPLAIYFTDDYVIYPKVKNVFQFIKRKRMLNFYRRTIKKSELSFAIGDLMAEKYSKFFGKKFLPIMNSIEVQEYIPYNKSQNVIYSYFGGLHLNRWKMLIKFADSISGGELHVYSIAKPEKSIYEKFKNAGIKFKGSVSGTKLQSSILSSSFLLHVESDDEDNRYLTKLSISTKIPEYLMSGRPIIGYGPIDVASMRILSDNNIGFVLPSSLSKKELSQELININSNFEFRNQIGKNGYEFALKYFDNKKLSEKFKQKLIELMDGS